MTISWPFFHGLIHPVSLAEPLPVQSAAPSRQPSPAKTVAPAPVAPIAAPPTAEALSSEALDSISISLMMKIKEHQDHAAFRELVELHQQAVIGTAAKMLNSLDDAHDIAQLVFLRIWKAAPRYEVTAKFTTWMFTILRNLVFNETRRRTRKPTASLDQPLFDDDDGCQRDVVDTAALRPDDVTLHLELEAAVDEAVEKLPKNQRLAVILRRHEDLPYEEIAEILGTTVPSVKSLLFRARTTLRELLRPYLAATLPGEEPEANG